MAIDPSMVKWDDSPKIDPRMVKWDDPKEKAGTLTNLTAGAVRGAGSIGATLLTPWDIATAVVEGKGLTLDNNRQRRDAMDAGLRELVNADTESLAFKGGKLATEIAGTSGVGGVLGNVATRLGFSQPVVQALATGGLSANGAGMPLRVAAGSVTGGATAGMVNPDDAGTGAVLGGALPVAGKVGGVVGKFIKDKTDDAAYSMMRSALKPVLKAQQNGDADVAVRTMLDKGVNATSRGVEKLRSMVDDVNNQISTSIANSTAQIPKASVVKALDPTRARFANQVSPASDLAAIDAVQTGFLQHPSIPGATIPVQQAQAMKQGTYGILRNKYGQLGSAETEAQKALARGLKDEIATAVPGIAGLNAEEAALIKTLKVAERRALMDMNKNPIGLAALAQNPISWAAFMADRSAAFKSVAARMAHKASGVMEAQGGLLGKSLESPVVRSGLLTFQADQ